MVLAAFQSSRGREGECVHVCVCVCARVRACACVCMCVLALNQMSLVHRWREPTLDLMCRCTFCPLRFSSTLVLQEAITANEKQAVLWETGNLVSFMTSPGPAMEF